MAMIIPFSANWEIELLQEYFNERDINEISRIPVSSSVGVISISGTLARMKIIQSSQDTSLLWKFLNLWKTIQLLVIGNTFGI